MSSVFIEGLNSHELRTLIQESVKEEVQKILIEYKENLTETPIKLLTRKEACKLLNISLPTLHDWTSRGIIPYYKINTRIRFKQEDIEKLLSNPTNLKYRRI